MSTNKLFLVFALVVSPASATLDFNGSNNYVGINEQLPTSIPFTIAFWYQSVATANTRQMFAVSSTSSTTPLISFIRLGSGDLGAAPCDVAGRISYKIRVGGAEDVTICNPVIVNDGVWHLVAAMAASATDHRVWIDGFISTSAVSCAMPTLDRTSIGARLRTTADRFEDANMNDVRIYDRALSDNELSSLYQGRARLHITDGLLYHWKMDEGADGQPATGFVTLDWSGSGKHLNAVAGPIYRASDFISYP